MIGTRTVSALALAPIGVLFFGEYGMYDQFTRPSRPRSPLNESTILKANEATRGQTRFQFSE